MVQTEEEEEEEDGRRDYLEEPHSTAQVA